MSGEEYRHAFRVLATYLEDQGLYEVAARMRRCGDAVIRVE